MRTLDTNRRDQVTVEAESVEDALAEISAQFGANAEIMRAQKVHRGGVGGFFAKEMVQLTARRRRESASVRPQPQPQPRQPQGGGIADVLERMAQDADAEDSDFRTVLQRELAAAEPEPDVRPVSAWSPPAPDPEPPVVVQSKPIAENPVIPLVATGSTSEDIPEPVVVGPVLSDVVETVTAVDGQSAADSAVPAPDSSAAVPVEFPVEPDFEEAASIEIDQDITDQPDNPVVAASSGCWRTAETTDAPEGMGSVAWSTTALLRLGLPAPVIAAVNDLDPNDDLGWIEAIAAAVAPHCGPLPEADAIIVGPHAERLAEPLNMPLVQSGEMAPYDGSFCAMVEDSPQDRQWLEFVRGGRGIHLVVGDESWHDLLVDEPVAVSWVGESAVVDALYLAFTLGATLGFGTVDGFVSSMVRPQPTDVALAVRRIVGRR